MYQRLFKKKLNSRKLRKINNAVGGIQWYIFSFSSYYVWGTLVIVKILDFRFLEDLYVLGSGVSKKHKISVVSASSLVSLLVSMLVS